MNSSDESFTFYVDGKPTQVRFDHPRFKEVIALAQAGDPSAVDVAKPAVVVAKAFDSLKEGQAKYFRRKAGNLQVSEWGVTLDGEPLHGYVVDRLMEFLKLGIEITPWVNFVRKLYQNPSSTSRNELFLWLEKAGMPITPDGDFLAYKKVRDDYKDIYTGKFDNSVGKVLEMNRLDVDDDRNQTCSAGLHFCSKDYLPQFGVGDGNRVVIVKINPADVVSIPSDYNDTKGRTWRYEVVGELTLEEAGLNAWGGPVNSDYGDEDDDIDFDEYDDDDLGFDDDDDDDDFYWLARRLGK